MDMNQNKRVALRDAGIRVLAAIGLVAVLAFATWGMVRVSEKAPVALVNLTAAVASLSSQFFPTSETGELTFLMPTRNAVSGKPFTFSWGGNHAGPYTFSYACRDGLTFEIPGGLSERETIACDTPFSFSNTTNTLTLIPSSAKNRFLDVAIAIETADELVSGSTIMTVVNESIAIDGMGNDVVAVTPLQPRTETEVIGVGTQTVSDPNGKTDLIGYLLAVGYIDENTNQFVATSSIERSAKAAVRFEVRNIGTKSSGEWNFKAELPTSPSHTYEPREIQQSLNPGERIEFTLSFDRVRRTETGVVVITLDPDTKLDEFTRVNNRIEAVFSIIQ
jgi:hypothetical protein